MNKKDKEHSLRRFPRGAKLTAVFGLLKAAQICDGKIKEIIIYSNSFY